jgi:hypothetical protein
MSKEFLPYNRALKLKQLGFDEPCFGYHYTLNGKDWKFADNHEYFEIDDQLVIGANFTLLAPLFQQAFRWFREKHNLISIITTTPSFDTMYASKYKSHTYYQFQPFKWVDGKYLINDTYEEAELACLDKLIAILELKHEIENL